MKYPKIDFPSQVDFETTLCVRVSDLNYGNHLGQDRLIALLHEARMRFLRSLGLSEMDLGGGVGLIVSHTYVHYCSEAFHGDSLCIRVAFGALSQTSFELLFEAIHTEQRHCIARAAIRHVCFDYKNRKPVKRPSTLGSP